jgi:hypothetical protein
METSENLGECGHGILHPLYMGVESHVTARCQAFSRLPTICACACARARMALALGKLNFSCAVIGLTCMPTKQEPLNLVVPVVNFPRANAILARAQALLWVRDWPSQWQKGKSPGNGVENIFYFLEPKILKIKCARSNWLKMHFQNRYTYNDGCNFI